jgi:hypothetical protein
MMGSQPVEDWLEIEEAKAASWIRVLRAIAEMRKR